MESQPIRKYVYLGGAARYLEDAQEGRPIHGEGFVLANINQLLSYLESLDLPVTARAARYVGLIKMRNELAELDEDAKLAADQATELGREMRKLRVTLFSESEGKEAFVVTSKRFDVQKLLHAPSELMAPGVFDELDEPISYDITEAGRCIAFERPTAAAFHLMRATEAALRTLYCAKVKRKRVDPLLWGSMVEHLRKRSDAPPRPLLDGLDNIRHNFRNPTQHPDAIYDIQEAQDLLSLSLDAVGRVVRALP